MAYLLPYITRTSKALAKRRKVSLGAVLSAQKAAVRPMS